MRAWNVPVILGIHAETAEVAELIAQRVCFDSTMPTDELGGEFMDFVVGRASLDTELEATPSARRSMSGARARSQSRS